MPAALIEFNERGGVKCVYLLVDSDSEQQLVERGLMRLTKAHHWAWLAKLYRRARGWCA